MIEERIKKLIQPGAVILGICFFISFFIRGPLEISEYVTCIEDAASGTAIVLIGYINYLWRYIPWNRPPLLKSRYNGIIKYKFNNIYGEKPITIKVKQTWLSIDVKTKTDINESLTTSASIVNEFNSTILYYTYITNPSACCQETNPIQYGACRIRLDSENSHLYGKYWTSSNTVGDIEWIADEES